MLPGPPAPPLPPLPATFEDYSREKAQERFRLFSLIGGFGYLYLIVTGALLYPEIPAETHELIILYRLLVAALFFFLSWRAATNPPGSFRTVPWGLALILLILLGYDRFMYLAHGVVMPMIGYLSAILIGWMIMMPGGARENVPYLAVILAGYAAPIFHYWHSPLPATGVLQANDSAPVLAGLALAGMQVLDTHRRREYDAHKQILAQNEILNRSAHYDPLTGAGNRRYLTERLAELFRLSERHGQPLACLMIDLDHFKNVNDSLGHAAGDDVLKGIARTVRPLLRTGDVFARYGGEEFVVLLPLTDSAGAKALAERLRAAVEKAVFQTHGQAVRITVSIGIAHFDRSQHDPDVLLELADLGLYRAKNAGRNRVSE